MRRILSNHFYLVGLLLYLAVIGGCSSTEKVLSDEADIKQDNLYDTDFPGRIFSKQLEYISGTVKKLDCLAFYMTYVFPPENNFKVESLTDSVLSNHSINRTVNNETVSGTAMVIYANGKNIGLLTCAHVVDFPDTIITRYENKNETIESISIKIKQQNYVKGLPVGNNIQVLAIDEKNDIAFITKIIDKEDEYQAVLNYPVGNTKDLQWGSVVYVMGFPNGKLMVTKALVSNPDKTASGQFFTDALYNRGISGSPVFAVRDGMPNFELVGMATSASAKQIYYVKPGKNEPDHINPEVPFTGDFYIDSYKDIKYGITFNVSIETIMDFLKENREILSDKGYYQDWFFK